MKLFHRLAALALVVSLCFLVALAAAQNPPGARPVVPAAAGPRLALLDVSRIFKEHVRFKQQMDEMKAEVQAAENAVRAKREEITKLGEKLQMLQKGTDQYKQIDEDITAKQTELMLSINRSKAKFLQREAEIYYGVYQEIYQATDYICKQNSIDMVLRFSGEEADVQRPDSVLAWINKPVVWFDPGLDITPLVLRDVNRTTAGAASAPRGPASPWSGTR